MEPRKDEKQTPKAAVVRMGEQRHRLRLIRLEERIAPRITANHNETLLRDRSAGAR
jgi:hypothetical protein